MDKLRLRYKKTGRAVYISHLDLMRVMQRAFSRAGVELKHSEGFNPHAIISVCLPLSVGAGSLCELMDFRLAGDEDLKALPEKLTAAMPEGIEALEVYPAERKITELKWLSVEGRFEYDSRDPESMAAGLMELFSKDELMIVKKTKRGEGEMDLAPHISSVALWPNDGFVRVEAVISAQEPTINPELLVSAVRRHAPEYEPDFAAFTRIETYDEIMTVFR